MNSNTINKANQLISDFLEAEEKNSGLEINNWIINENSVVAAQLGAEATVALIRLYKSTQNTGYKSGFDDEPQCIGAYMVLALWLKFVEPLSEDKLSVTLTDMGIDFAKELLAKGIDPDEEEGASNEND